MILEGTDEQTVLVTLYVMVDDLVKALQTSQEFRLRLSTGRPSGRPPRLSLSEIVALGLFRYALNIKDVKHFHRHIASHYSRYFPGLPNYQNFLSHLNRVSPYVCLLVLWIAAINREEAKEPFFVDTTSLKVCENRRIFDHKVCRGLATRGKTTMGWFYGFKLGFVVDALGRLLSVAIRPGNTDDRKFLEVLFQGLKGLGIGDAGFLSQDWMARLWEKGLFFITDVKKSMKRLMTPEQHALLKMRQRIEISFSQLKHRLQQAVTLARSPQGYFARWFYAVLAYSLFPLMEAA